MSPKYMTLSIDELIDDYEHDEVKSMDQEAQKAWYSRKLRAMEDIHEVRPSPMYISTVSYNLSTCSFR